MPNSAEPPTEESASAVANPTKHELAYNSHLEELISSEAEKALVLRWLHNNAELRYSRFNTWITLPVITISTLAGTASIGSESLFGPDARAAPVLIGLMSLVVSILNVIASFFGWAKRAEGHRISSINYGKMHRWISIELALPRDQRIPAKHFLKEIRQQIDRMNETSPQIPPEAISQFRTKLKDLKSDVSVPEICDEIHCVKVYTGEEGEAHIEKVVENEIVERSVGILSEPVEEQKEGAIIPAVAITNSVAAVRKWAANAKPKGF